MASSNRTIQCWKCGATLRNLLLPFSRYEECSTSNAGLHACISYKNYAPNLADSCSEDCAESVLDNEKANFATSSKPIFGITGRHTNVDRLHPSVD
jgi:hypothetical protein